MFGFFKKIISGKTEAEGDAYEVLSQCAIDVGNLDQELKKREEELKLLEGGRLNNAGRDEIKRKILSLEDSIFKFFNQEAEIKKIRETKEREEFDRQSAAQFEIHFRDNEQNQSK